MHRLAELRKAARLTQPELGAAAGVARETISNIERGFSEPGVPVALDLAAALGTTVEDIFGESKIPPATAPRGVHVGFSITLDPTELDTVVGNAIQAGFTTVSEYIRHRLLTPTA